MSNKTDEEIVARVQSGDVESFGLLVERYQPKLLRYGRKFVADKEDINDLVQEVFIKSYINIKSFDLKRRFSPWIYRIAHNGFVNALKKKSRLPIFSFDLDTIFPHPIAKESADEGINKQDLKRTLDKLMDKIDAKYKETLILHYLEDMGYKEIAEIMQIPISTVGIRLKRGKEFLKKIIEKQNN